MISDERLVQLYTLIRYPLIVDGLDRDFIELLLEQLPIIKDEVLSIINTDKNVSYKSGKIRLDWVCNKIKIPEGIYLIKELTLKEDFSLPKIISDTYYEG